MMAQLDRTGMLAALETWQATMRDVEAGYRELRRTLGSDPDAPLPAAISAMQSDYTASVAARCRVSADWLEAWWLECDLGERPLRAGIVGEPVRTITSLAELLALIIDDDATTHPGTT